MGKYGHQGSNFENYESNVNGIRFTVDVNQESDMDFLNDPTTQPFIRPIGKGGAMQKKQKAEQQVKVEVE